MIRTPVLDLTSALKAKVHPSNRLKRRIELADTVKKYKKPRTRTKVAKCALFKKRAFQYGPACAIAEQEPSRILVNYPLGTGKTLAAWHAARTFLEGHPGGHIVVLTTLSNVESTWAKNLRMYLPHVCDENIKSGLKNASVHNVDWWFSKNNTTVSHYNRLIHELSKSKLSVRSNLIETRPSGFRDDLRRYSGSKKPAAQKAFEHFKRTLTPKQKQARQTMLEAAMPRGPFLLIVDECQEYINPCANTKIVNALANAATKTLLLSATPLDDVLTQDAGLARLMRVRSLSRKNLSGTVLSTVDASEKPLLVDLGVRKVRMISMDWLEHKRAASARTSTNDSRNAYLVKSREACNCRSKWTEMFDQIQADIARFSKTGGPIRIVVYSNFVPRGSEGFFQFLRLRTGGRVKKGRLKCTVGEHAVKVSLMEKNTLEWFNAKRAKTRCKILLLTSRSGLGISLKNVCSFHLMEPQWAASAEEQAIGRCTRKGSHDLIAPRLEITRWMSVPPKNALKWSADEKVHMRMSEKKQRTSRFLEVLQKYGRVRLNSLLSEFRRG